MTNPKNLSHLKKQVATLSDLVTAHPGLDTEDGRKNINPCIVREYNGLVSTIEAAMHREAVGGKRCEPFAYFRQHCLFKDGVKSNRIRSGKVSYRDLKAWNPHPVSMSQGGDKKRTRRGRGRGRRGGGGEESSRVPRPDTPRPLVLPPVSPDATSVDPSTVKIVSVTPHRPARPPGFNSPPGGPPISVDPWDCGGFMKFPDGFFDNLREPPTKREPIGQVVARFNAREARIMERAERADAVFQARCDRMYQKFMTALHEVRREHEQDMQFASEAHSATMQSLLESKNSLLEERAAVLSTYE